MDDRLVICGSANINDRSLLGNRDSEVTTPNYKNGKKLVYILNKNRLCSKTCGVN